MANASVCVCERVSKKRTRLNWWWIRRRSARTTITHHSDRISFGRSNCAQSFCFFLSFVRLTLVNCILNGRKLVFLSSFIRFIHSLFPSNVCLTIRESQLTKIKIGKRIIFMTEDKILTICFYCFCDWAWVCVCALMFSPHLITAMNEETKRKRKRKQEFRMQLNDEAHIRNNDMRLSHFCQRQRAFHSV